MNTFCEKCGSPVTPGAAFCSACGNKINAPAPQPQYAQPQYAQPQYAPAPKSKKTLILVLAAVLVVAAIAVTLILVLGGPSVDPEKLNGSWDGTITVQAVGDGSEEAIGISADYIGHDDGIGLEVSLDKNGEGTMTTYPYECEATYKGGKFVADSSPDDSVILHMEGTASKDGDSYSLRGSWNFKDGSGRLLASGTWHAEMLK